MKVKAIWEFDADVSDISPDYVDVEGWAKELAKDELNNMLLNFELSGEDFQFEVVKEPTEDERELYNHMCCSAVNENVIYVTQEVYERMKANPKKIVINTKGKPLMMLKVIGKGKVI